MSSRKFTKEDIQKALEESYGLLSGAAFRLKCSRQTISKYVNEIYPDLKDVVKEVQEQTLDFVENKLLQLIAEGDRTAIIFYLKTKGKHRGYSEFNTVNVMGLDLANISKDVLDKLTYID